MIPSLEISPVWQLFTLQPLPRSEQAWSLLLPLLLGFRYYAESSTGLCKRCNKSCKGCRGPKPTDCLSCDPFFFLLQAKGECHHTCPDHYHAEQRTQTCVRCHPTCNKCKGELFLPAQLLLPSHYLLKHLLLVNCPLHQLLQLSLCFSICAWDALIKFCPTLMLFRWTLREAITRSQDGFHIFSLPSLSAVFGTWHIKFIFMVSSASVSNSLKQQLSF